MSVAIFLGNFSFNKSLIQEAKSKAVKINKFTES